MHNERMKMSITTKTEPPRHTIQYTPIMSFYGDCMGVALVKRFLRGNLDQHLSFVMIYEDDGDWYESKGDGIDSYWLPEMIEALQEAYRWLKANARKSKDGLGWESKK
jgi:hypothetical protein